MLRKIIIVFVVLISYTISNALLASSKDVFVNCKTWPVNYFINFRKLTMQQKEKLFSDTSEKLNNINRDGYGMVVKGTIIDNLNLTKKVYKQLKILDESCLIVIVHAVPNIYYNYTGPKASINKNTYMVIKNVKLDLTESHILNRLVVEGYYLAFVHKYIVAILESIKNTQNYEAVNQLRHPQQLNFESAVSVK